LSAQHIADQLAGLSCFGQRERTVNPLSVAARGNYAGRLQNRPKSTIHSGTSAQEMADAGVTDGLVRISVGIEDWRDLLRISSSRWRSRGD
jgi:cystathionine beta-lyase/cystathionine gamma-synthase